MIGRAGVVTVTLTDQQKQGMVNNGYTFAAIREAVETADEDQVAAIQHAFVRLHLLPGVPHDLVAEIAASVRTNRDTISDPFPLFVAPHPP